ncbi:hypothetical protein K7X08_022586 [Anisodus acutangulus]|uniref:ER lumen protein retaining receptor n=2 Tax=Anisodus TaxID=243963 RepID=A0A9Q1MIB1_9SOLA|nr:hypothetical protein K7X08_022586 [Anisodus acutangulus]KAK4374795.1 hypothetical protein RND71_005472 [Anisodus tanguticus]
MGEKGLQTPAKKLFLWVRKQSKKVKTVLGFVTCLTLLLTLRLLIHDHNHFFVLAELLHFIGLLCLIYKLSTLKTCSGLSLKTQVLTAIFLAVRVFCSFIMEGDIHTILDFVTLVATLWVIYMMKFKLKSSYMENLDTMHYWYLIVPCAVAAIFIHPATAHFFLFRILWAFCVYLESISVLPQLRLMQNVQIIEPFTAHYVFALGVARFLGCAHWINQVYDTRGAYLYLAGRGYFWIPMVFLAEIVQTFILADFCYYYIKSVISGQLLVRLPQPV